MTSENEEQEGQRWWLTVVLAPLVASKSDDIVGSLPELEVDGNGSKFSRPRVLVRDLYLLAVYMDVGFSGCW